MLFIVLALLLLLFYLLKRFLTARAGNTPRDLIKVLTVHHLSPKEKLVLINVMDETILIGVTPNQISNIKTMDKSVDVSSFSKGTLAKTIDSGFPDLLKRTLGRSSTEFKKNGSREKMPHGETVPDE